MAEKHEISCPKCGHEFPIEDVLSKQLEEQYKEKFREEVNDLEEKYSQKESALKAREQKIKDQQKEMDAKVEELVKSREKEIEEAASKKANDQFNEKMESLNKDNAELSEKIRNLTKIESDYERLKREMKTQKEEIEADMEKKYSDRLEKEIEADRKKMAESYQNKFKKQFEDEMKALREENEENNQKIKELNTARIENERLKRSMQDMKQEFELEYEKKITEDREKLRREIQRTEIEKHQLKLREKEELIKSLREQVEEVKRRAEQGSMERQGEIQELELEDILKEMFPFDKIEDVPKGIKGADVIQTVRDSHGREIGKIVYESKRTKHFSNDWIQKLKDDTVSVRGDVSIIVTEALPDDIEKIGFKEDVWICSFHDFKGLAMSLRYGLLKIGILQQSQANTSDKMKMLYDFLTSNEFKMQIETIIDGFESLHESYLKEKRSMERIWKEREKQLERILLNTNQFIGSIQGIAGSSIPELEQIDRSGNLLNS